MDNNTKQNCFLFIDYLFSDVLKKQKKGKVRYICTQVKIETQRHQLLAASKTEKFILKNSVSVHSFNIYLEISFLLDFNLNFIYFVQKKNALSLLHL